MSLIEPTWLDFIRRHKTKFVIAGLAVLLIGVALFLYDCGEAAWFKSKVQKQKDAIANDAKEIANVTNQIANLELKREGLRTNVNTSTQELTNSLFGLEDAKKQTNQALANLDKAVNSNSNVDRTVDDLNKVLERLDGQQ